MRQLRSNRDGTAQTGSRDQGSFYYVIPGLTRDLWGKMGKRYYTYILASKKDGVLYIGITNNLKRRVYFHKGKYDTKGFTSRYFIDKLVYFEEYDNPLSAIEREKRLKRWKRDWKIELIEKENPNWDDLYKNII